MDIRETAELVGARLKELSLKQQVSLGSARG